MEFWWEKTIEGYFALRWPDRIAGGRPPTIFYDAIRRQFSDAEPRPEVLHPLEAEDDGIEFLMIQEGILYILRFDPPGEAIITTLGPPLEGGRYTEVIAYSHEEAGSPATIRGTMEHERLGNRTLTIAWRADEELPGVSGPRQLNAAKRATDELRALFRGWASRAA